MRSETRLTRFLANFSKTFKEKFSFFQMSFSSAIFFLFSGFLAGNVFGTFLNGIRTVFPWDGFIVGIFIFFVEMAFFKASINSVRDVKLFLRFFCNWL